MSDSAPPSFDGDGDESHVDARRGGFDGAGWFLGILFVALMYGLAFGALSGDRDDASAETPVPEPQTALVLHRQP